MIRAVIFDLGHTLWDIAPHDDGLLDQAYAAMRTTLCDELGHRDVPSAHALRSAVSEALRADRDTYFELGQVLEQPPTHHWVERACLSLGLDLPEALLCRLTPPLFATEIERLVCAGGTREALLDLRERGYRLGCVTNTLADASTIRSMLGRYALLDVMESVVVSSHEGWRKPHPSLFEKALRELDVRADEAVFVGDSIYHDVAGAKACGMRAVLTRQYVTRPHVDGCPNPDAVIEHVRELPAVIAALDGDEGRLE